MLAEAAKLFGYLPDKVEIVRGNGYRVVGGSFRDEFSHVDWYLIFLVYVILLFYSTSVAASPWAELLPTANAAKEIRKWAIRNFFGFSRQKEIE